MVPPGHTGDWHFCRGVWDSERQCFKSYAEMGEPTRGMIVQQPGVVFTWLWNARATAWHSA
jgi:hypothetical protein